MTTTKQKLKLPASTLVVTQSNDLVQSRYNLPLAEMRLLFSVIAKIQPKDTKMTTYHIPIAAFAKVLGIDKNSAYREMRKITKSLVTRFVEIKEPDGDVQTTWFAQAKYIDGAGIVEVQLSESMIPHLLQLKNGNFTQCKLAMLVSFKSVYTTRLYMLLKQKRDYNPCANAYEFDLSELRKQLGVSIPRIEKLNKADKVQEAKELYPEYPDFKRRVLEVAKKEMGDSKGETGKGDLGFEYDEIKHGRRVAAINFRVFSIQRIEVLPPEDQPSPAPETKPADLDLVATLLSFVPDPHRVKKSVRSSIEAAEKQHGFDYVKRNILYCNGKDTKNYAGYLSGALDLDYAHDQAIDEQQAAKAAATAKTPTVTLVEINNLINAIKDRQAQSKAAGDESRRDTLWQQAEALKAEYAQKLEIYSAANAKEEATQD